MSANPVIVLSSEDLIDNFLATSGTCETCGKEFTLFCQDGEVNRELIYEAHEENDALSMVHWCTDCTRPEEALDTYTVSKVPACDTFEKYNNTYMRDVLFKEQVAQGNDTYPKHRELFKY